MSHVCWQTEQIHKVLDTDALHVQRHLFLATHHPIKMYKQTAGTKVQNRGVAYDEVEFLQDFITKKEYIFVPILGESGTGKSHLVRWLDAQIPKEGRKVLLIPRLTNLKDIILMILKDLEEPEFEDFRQRVRQSTGNVSFGQAKEMLLNNITLAIGPNGNHSIERLDDLELHLMENLPHLFRDPALFQEWLKEGGVIHQLASHIIGGNGGRLNERREFSIQDLPLNITFIDKASQDAKSIYADLVGDYELQQKAVEWLNLNLDSAISAMLNLSSTDLIKLMKQVRAALARKNIELVLLIEDFTVLQGIDYQLLDALIYKQADNDGEEQLCDMRVALGCTTGYFQRFEDTVLTRTDFRVILDVDEELLKSGDVERFAARYLNVLRMPEDRIKQWFDEEGIGKPLRSACVELECPMIHQCHEAFGQIDGIGLYPFNDASIHTMYKRSTKEENFNPRLMISKVLRYITENYAESIKEGTFPSTALFDHFGGKTVNRLSTMAKNEIERKDPVDYDRRHTLIELWTNEYEVTNLHPFVHESFKLPLLNIRENVQKEVEKVEPNLISEATKDPTDPTNNHGLNDLSVKDQVKGADTTSTLSSVNPPKSSLNQLPQNVEQKIRTIDEWVNEGKLSQNLTQELRELVFDSLNDYIQWDIERINHKWFQDSGLWSKKSINFTSQSTQMGTGPILLHLPQKESEWKDTALVLQGLIYFSHFKHWEFRQGAEYLRFVARYLNKWSETVLAQFREIPLDDGPWNPLPIATEVLVVTAAMSGIVSNNSSENLISSMFDPITQQDGIRTSEWDKVLRTLLQHREEISKFALSRLAIKKGDTGRVRVIDSSKIINQLATLSLENLTTPPTDRVNAFDRLVRCSELLQKSLLKAIETEHQDKKEWVVRIREVLGDKFNGKKVANQVKQAYKSAISTASLRGEGPKIEAAITGLESRPIDQFVKKLNAMEGNTPLELVIGLGQLPVAQMTEVENHVKILEKFLDESTSKIERDLNELQNNEAVMELEKVKVEINDHLKLITACFDSIRKGGTTC
ncbi:hypothetical protein EDM56_02140 [Brevibacillus fluminis]|uniref:ATP-binding protein n=1 Tax=Brevibacillus fluminis TaxID=511487 RepID=A0A3M8DZV3_9BACL|nr:protein DpdH [Brevibacillus fluminis]RNB92517.1 hypothetical protein EDM56_02140 [Brevibacillus fluminis]